MAGIQDLDANFRASRLADGLRWWGSGFAIAGRGWADAEPYTRLPERARGVVPAAVWDLSRTSAGVCLEFATASPHIAVRWKLRSKELGLSHMPASGASGVDLYARADDGWRWAGLGGASTYPWNQAQLLKDLPPRPREARIYLPLYNGVSEVEIGLAPDSALAPLEPTGARPVVVYGTSIVQGGCASRPGMAYPAILGRLLGSPVINLGFSGNARMEPALAELLGEIDASAYVLDCLPNMWEDEIAQRVGPFVRALRARSAAPIVLVENIIYQTGWIDPAKNAGHVSKNAVLRRAADDLLASACADLRYVPGGTLLGEDGEGTVDGTHPTDIGFARIAAAIAPALRALR